MPFFLPINKFTKSFKCFFDDISRFLLYTHDSLFYLLLFCGFFSICKGYCLVKSRRVYSHVLYKWGLSLDSDVRVFLTFMSIFCNLAY